MKCKLDSIRFDSIRIKLEGTLGDSKPAGKGHNQTDFAVNDKGETTVVE